MRTLLAATLLAAIAVTATGCPALGCGGYSGGGDTVYVNGTEQLVLCDNGGFVADLSTGTVEGYYTKTDNGSGNTVEIDGTNGATDQPAFVVTYNFDGTYSIPQLDGGAWTTVTLDKTGLDHADARCQDVTTQPWWNATR